MEIDIKTAMSLLGFTANDRFLPLRNIKRKQERKLRKKFGGRLSEDEIKQIAKVHPTGKVEIINVG